MGELLEDGLALSLALRHPVYSAPAVPFAWMLREAMEAQGFAVYEAEWWHFDYRDRRSYRLGNERFEELGIGDRP